MKNQSRYAMLPRQAVVDTDLSATEFKLLAVIGLFLNADYEAWPSQDTLAEMSGMSRSTIIRTLQKLEDKNYIVSRKKYPNRPGTHKCYAVVMDGPEIKSDTSESVTSDTSECRIQGDTSGSSTQGDTSHKNYPVELPSRTLLSDSDPTPAEQPDNLTLAINTIWKAWSKKGRKRSKAIELCRDVLRRQATKHDLREITKAALRYAKSTDGEFHKGLHDWLAGGYWQNFLTNQPDEQAVVAAAATPSDKLDYAFKLFAEFGNWTGDTFGQPLKPDHPDATYPAALYAKYGLKAPEGAR